MLICTLLIEGKNCILKFLDELKKETKNNTTLPRGEISTPAKNNPRKRKKSSTLKYLSCAEDQSDVALSQTLKTARPKNLRRNQFFLQSFSVYRKNVKSDVNFRIYSIVLNHKLILKNKNCICSFFIIFLTSISTVNLT